jgi:predicted nuclease with TOPRIM domain
MTDDAFDHQMSHLEESLTHILSEVQHQKHQMLGLSLRLTLLEQQAMTSITAMERHMYVQAVALTRLSNVGNKQELSDIMAQVERISATTQRGPA